MTLDIKKAILGNQQTLGERPLDCHIAQVILMLPRWKIMKYSKYHGRVYWEINKH